MVKKKLSKKERIEKTAGLIVGTIILAIIFTTAIFFIKQKYFGSTFEYKGYKVTKVKPEGTSAVFYVLRAPIRIYGETKVYYINLYNDPRTLQNISVEDTTREVLLDPKPKHVYITFDPDMPKKGYIALAATELARILGLNGIFKFAVSGAVTKDIGLENKTITCEDSSENVLVIELKYSNTTNIYVDETKWRCVIVEASNEYNLLRASDKVVLTLLGL